MECVIKKGESIDYLCPWFHQCGSNLMSTSYALFELWIVWRCPPEEVVYTLQTLEYNFKIIHFFFFENQNNTCLGIKDSDKDIGLWARSEDAKETEYNQVLIRVSRLLGQGQGLVTTSRWCSLRRQTSSENRMEDWGPSTQPILSRGPSCLGG